MEVVVRTISDQVIDVLRERILTGRMAPDVPIRQDIVAQELGISKIPLREALARLEQEGLLVSHANRGYFVRAMSRDELEEIFAIRLKLEPNAVAAGAAAANDAQRRTAIAALANFKAEADISGISGGSHNRAFHIALIAPNSGRLTSDVLTRLHVLADRYVCKHLEPLGRASRADQEHDEILEAWLARDKKVVAALTKQHIQGVLSDLRRVLGSKPATVAE